jgi:hypothetical protein
MLSERTKRILYNVLWSPAWPLGVVLTIFGTAGVIGGILTWQHHGTHNVIIGGLMFLVAGLAVCAAVVDQARKQP